MDLVHKVLDKDSGLGRGIAVDRRKLVVVGIEVAEVLGLVAAVAEVVVAVRRWVEWPKLLASKRSGQGGRGTWGDSGATHIENGWIIGKILLWLGLCLLLNAQILYITASEYNVRKDLC